MKRQQRLVGCHHRLACAQGGQDHVLGGGGAADQFHHQIHLGIIHHRTPIGCEGAWRHFEIAFLPEAAHRHARHPQAHT